MSAAESRKMRPFVFGLAPMMIFIFSCGVLGATGTELSASGGPARLVIFGTAYGWAVLWLATHREHAMSFLSGTSLLWLLPAYALLSMAWSLYPHKALIDAGHLWGVAFVAWSAVAATHAGTRAISVALLAATTGVLAISLLTVQAGFGFSIDPETGRWAGATGNANTLGMVCMITIASGTYLFLTSKSLLPRLLLLVPLALALVNLRGSGSATSLVVSVLAVAGLCWLLLGRSNVSSRVGGRVGVGLILVGLAAAVILPMKPELLHMDTLMRAVGRSANFTGREELWAFALEQFRDQPWLGFGFDSLSSVIGKVNMAVGQLHNGYLDLLVRGGVVGMSLFVLMTLAALTRSFFTATRTTDLIWSTVLLAAILVHNISESSLARSTHTLWLLYMIAAFVAARRATLANDAAVGITNDAPSHADSASAPALPNLLR
jgi:exopolysaccharide production protein ExoQ